MEAGEIERLAGELSTAWATRTPAAPSVAPESIEEGYRAQARLVEMVGTAAGYKVGYTNRVLQERFGIDGPVSGRLWSHRIFESGATLSVPPGLDLIVEPEFAYRMAKDLPSSAGPFTAEMVAEAVDAIMPALEIVEPRPAGWQSGGVPLTVADNVLHSAWIGAQPILEWSAEAVPEQVVVAYINGGEVSRGSGAAVLGDPFGVMVWLANGLAERGEGLRAGEIVTTGCCTDVLQPGRQDEVRADFGPFGQVSVRFTSDAGWPD